MPGRNRVQVRYVKAGSTPSSRSNHKKPNGEIHKIPEGLSPLAAYVTENEDTGLPVQELISQFQEFDCEHLRVEVITTTAIRLSTRCLDCGLIETKFKPGERS